MGVVDRSVGWSAKGAAGQTARRPRTIHQRRAAERSANGPSFAALWASRARHQPTSRLGRAWRSSIVAVESLGACWMRAEAPPKRGVQASLRCKMSCTRAPALYLCVHAGQQGLGRLQKGQQSKLRVLPAEMFSCGVQVSSHALLRQL